MSAARPFSAYPLACPVCGAPLQAHAHAVGCQNSHSFDIAKEGYLNLLVAQHKSRGIDGDLTEMLRARRRFLEAGFYLPLRVMLAEKVAEILASRRDTPHADPRAPGVDPAPAPCVLEVGCGEGYYIGGIAAHVGEGAARSARPAPVFLGTDLSKPAVRLAARAHPEVLFFVADVHRRIYLQDEAVSVVVDVFAPRNANEFARVLEPGGSVLVVIPAESHLENLREELGLLGIEQDKEQRVLDRFAGFHLADRRESQYPLRLPAAAVLDALEMGPNFHHRPEDLASRGEAAIETEASFILLHLVKGGAA